VALGAAVVVGLVVFVGWWAFAPPWHGVNRACFEQIQRGMTEQQVQTVFGEPPLREPHYKPFDLTAGEWDWLGNPPPDLSVEWRLERWRSGPVDIMLAFGPEGTVTAKRYQEWRDPSPLLDRIQQWLSG
jgi:hypothetical protein